MEDPGVRLTKEENSLNALKETVNRSTQLCSGICSILVSFDNHLMKLERTILPVYQETGDLQRKQENIGKILENLDHVIQFYTVSKDVENIIQDGPSGSLEKFLEALERLNSAINFFEDSNPGCSELTELSSLFDIGRDRLESEFRIVLANNTKPYPVIEILDLIGMEEFEVGIPPEIKKITSQQLPDSVRQSLMKMANWLHYSSKNINYTESFSQIRSGNVERSMQSLKDHQKTASGSSGSSTYTVQNSPQLNTRKSIGKDTTPRKPPKTLHHFMKRTATAVIAKYSPGGESAVLGHRLPTALLQNDPKDEVPESEVISFMTSISAFLKLMQCEYQLMEGIIFEPHRTRIFEMISETAMNNLKNDSEHMVTRVKKCVTKHDFSAALNLFPILRHLTSIQPEFDNMFKCNYFRTDPACDTRGCLPRNQLQVITITLHTTLNKALEEFIESIRRPDPDTKMPRDGTVHELTSNAMMLLEQLLENQDILRNVLVLQDESFTYSKDTAKLAFAQYITRVLTAMGLKLQNKSESYSDPYLKAIFRINNLHYILKSLQRTGLIDVVHLHYPNAESHYNDQILDQKRIYSQSWSRILHYVMEVDRPISQQRTATAMTQLKDKDRQSIKDKFTGFNKEMDEIYRIQKGYAIPDIELRESLKKENKNYIIPKYEMFYQKYVNIAFTKNPEKYLKYSPRDVAETMDKFFDAAA